MIGGLRGERKTGLFPANYIDTELTSNIPSLVCTVVNATFPGTSQRGITQISLLMPAYKLTICVVLT